MYLLFFVLFLYEFNTNMATKPRTKYHYFGIGMTRNMMEEIRKECFQLQISKQDFMRALVRDYFLRNKGIDIFLQIKEKLYNPNENE